MSETNGTLRPGVLRLGDVSPKRRPVEVVRDGEPVTLQGYVNCPRCPASIKSQASSAFQTWKDSGESDPTNEAWYTYVRDLLLTVVSNLEFGEADVMASDTETAGRVLRYLEWWAEPGAAEDDADPEVSGEVSSSTTALSSPSSAPSTVPTTG